MPPLLFSLPVGGTHLFQSRFLNLRQYTTSYRGIHDQTVASKSRNSEVGRAPMTPPCQSFPASELPARVQNDVHGRRRKHDTINGSPTPHRVDLAACELLQMLQYKCQVQNPVLRSSPVQCFPVQRLFRRYVSVMWNGKRSRKLAARRQRRLADKAAPWQMSRQEGLIYGRDNGLGGTAGRRCG